MLSGDQVTTKEHEANSHSLLQHPHEAQRLPGDARKKECQHDTEYKDEKGLERIDKKDERDGREERCVKRDGFADADQYPAQRDKAKTSELLLVEKPEKISPVPGNAA